MPSPGAGPTIPQRQRQAWFGGWRTVPVFNSDRLAPGMVIEGPMIIEAETTSVLATTDDIVSVNLLGWLGIAARVSRR